MIKRLRPSDVHESGTSAVPVLPDRAGETLPNLDGGEMPALAGYLTLELDVRDFQAYCAADDNTKPRGGSGQQAAGVETFDWPDSVPEDMSLGPLEGLEPELTDFPGYLTIEIEETPGDCTP